MTRFTARQLTVFLLALGVLLSLPALAEPPTRITAGAEHEGSIETRNAAVEVGDDARVNGNISARNGGVRIGERVTAGDIETRNGSVSIGAGSQLGGIQSRNGSIRIGTGSTVARIETRNGGIEIGRDSTVGGAVESRNGKIDVATNVTVSGDLEARNGAIELAPEALVEGSVASRNGDIQLQQAQVTGNVTSLTGDLILRQASQVGGNLVIEISEGAGERGWFGFGSARYPEAGSISILEGSEVAGDVIIALPEDYDREPPTVRVDASSRVMGAIRVDSRVSTVIDGQSGG
ncbi:MAG: hypothetical protein V2J42_05175 [Wenzhouxiangella sp.]|jgi:hypothetical protein|nr:hypothetical protein [Wenzhouxiangella sp.]